MKTASCFKLRTAMVMICIMLATLAGLPGKRPAWAAQPALVEMDFKAPENIWVGQRVTINVTLSGVGQFAGSPVFDLPQIPGALIMKIEDRPIIGNRQLDGVEYITQIHELAVFPQRAGDFRVPPFNVRFGVRSAPDKAPDSYTLATEEIGFKAVTPPGANGLGSIISAEKLTVTQTWSPEPPAEAIVGSAYTRTVTFQSSDIPGMAFPPLPDISIRGLGVYPKPPIVQDRVDRGDFTGSRVETVVYILEQPGTIAIPALIFHWWDMGRQEMQSITFPALTIEAKPSPIAQENQTSPASPSQASQRRLLFPLAVLAAVIAIFFIFRKKLARLMNGWIARRKQRESAYFSRLIRTCEDHDPVAALNAFLQWMSKVDDAKVDDGRTITIAGFISKYPVEDLSWELNELQKAAIKLRTDWNGKKLSRLLARVRSQVKRKKTIVPANTLPGLNPPG